MVSVSGSSVRPDGRRRCPPPSKLHNVHQVCHATPSGCFLQGGGTLARCRTGRAGARPYRSPPSRRPRRLARPPPLKPKPPAIHPTPECRFGRAGRNRHRKPWTLRHVPRSRRRGRPDQPAATQPRPHPWLGPLRSKTGHAVGDFRQWQVYVTGGGGRSRRSGGQAVRRAAKVRWAVLWERATRLTK